MSAPGRPSALRWQTAQTAACASFLTTATDRDQPRICAEKEEGFRPPDPISWRFTVEKIAGVALLSRPARLYGVSSVLSGRLVGRGGLLPCRNRSERLCLRWCYQRLNARLQACYAAIYQAVAESFEKDETVLVKDSQTGEEKTYQGVR